MAFLTTLFYFIVVICVLVLVHELGHFLAARMTGTRADIFSIGMGKRICGFNKKLGFTFGNLPKDYEGDGCTDYRLSLLPIGGYVKIVGMVDESMDTDFAQRPPEPWEFRSKNTFQKAFMLSAGVVMNALLAIIIFAWIAYTDGDINYKSTTVSYVKPGSIADRIGIENGDKVVSINGKSITTWNEVIEYLAIKDFGSKRNVVVERGNNTVYLQIPGKEIVKGLAGNLELGLEPVGIRTLILAADITKPAGKAGLKANDTIIAVNGKQVAFTEFSAILKQNKNKKVLLEWKRGAQTLRDSIAPNSDGLIGVSIAQIYVGSFENVSYSLPRSIAIGYEQTAGSLKMFYDSFAQIFAGNMSFKQSVGGPVMIAKQAAQNAERGLDSFLKFMALLSISLAVINILPFPALDGGHLVFTIIEGIIRREVPVKVKMAFQQVGIIILLLFMGFVIYNDLVR